MKRRQQIGLSDVHEGREHIVRWLQPSSAVREGTVSAPNLKDRPWKVKRPNGTQGLRTLRRMRSIGAILRAGVGAGAFYACRHDVDQRRGGVRSSVRVAKTIMSFLCAALLACSNQQPSGSPLTSHSVQTMRASMESSHESGSPRWPDARVRTRRRG